MNPVMHNKIITKDLIILILGLYISICSIFLGCVNDLSQPDAAPVSLLIESLTFTIPSGSSLQLTAMAEFPDGKIDDVTEETIWSIEPGIAGTINSAGCFTAIVGSTGFETVRADYLGKTAQVEIQVVPGAQSFAVWPVVSRIVSGMKIQFNAFALFHGENRYAPSFTEIISEETDWSVIPGETGEIDEHGLFTSRWGSTGVDTIIASFQSFVGKSVVRVQQKLEMPFEMVTIPAGSFIMGDDDGSYKEKPAHEVYVDEFQIGKYEVTNAQYVDFLNEALKAGEIVCEDKTVISRQGPYAWNTYLDIFGCPQFPDVFIEVKMIGSNERRFSVVPGYEQYPILRLNWYGAAAFCAYYGLRLPTEAEWEKACRGGMQLEYGTEDGTINQDLANLFLIGEHDYFDGPAPVGSFSPNPYGLYDMCSNVAEYVFDAYDRNYYSYSPSDNPKGPGPEIVLESLPGRVALWRGGSWAMHPEFCRSAYRGVIADIEDHNYLGPSSIGFRVARSY